MRAAHEEGAPAATHVVLCLGAGGVRLKKRFHHRLRRIALSGKVKWK